MTYNMRTTFSGKETKIEERGVIETLPKSSLNKVLSADPYFRLRHPQAEGLLSFLCTSYRMSLRLYRFNLREITTCIVTETVCIDRSSTTYFLRRFSLSCPPTTLVACWSSYSLSILPRCPKLSTARVISLWLRLS